MTMAQVTAPFQERLSESDRELITTWCQRNYERFRNARLEDMADLVDLMVYRIWERDFTKDPREFADAKAYAAIVLTYRLNKAKRIEIPKDQREVVAAEAVDLTAQAFGVKLKMLTSQTRVKNVLNARHLCMYMMRRKLQLSFTEIGRAFHRDHATAISAVNKVEGLLHHYDDVRNQYTMLCEYCAAHGLPITPEIDDDAQETKAGDHR